MRPRDLTEYFHAESFKPAGGSVTWPAGAFDYQLSLYLSDPQLTDQLCEWLSCSCTENFVVLREESALIAGGTTDNRLSWEQRRKYKRDSTVELIVRLHQPDVLMFKLAWFDRP